MWMDASGKPTPSAITGVPDEIMKINTIENAGHRGETPDIGRPSFCSLMNPNPSC